MQHRRGARYLFIRPTRERIVNKLPLPNIVLFLMNSWPLRKVQVRVWVCDRVREFLEPAVQSHEESHGRYNRRKKKKESRQCLQRLVEISENPRSYIEADRIRLQLDVAPFTYIRQTALRASRNIFLMDGRRVIDPFFPPRFRVPFSSRHPFLRHIRHDLRGN